MTSEFDPSQTSDDSWLEDLKDILYEEKKPEPPKPRTDSAGADIYEEFGLGDLLFEKKEDHRPLPEALRPIAPDPRRMPPQMVRPDPRKEAAARKQAQQQAAMEQKRQKQQAAAARKAEKREQRALKRQDPVRSIIFLSLVAALEAVAIAVVAVNWIQWMA